MKTSPEHLTWALALTKRFGTYAEWSVSGNGLHLIGIGTMPDADGTPQKGRNDQTKGLEAYSRRRFATFTGKVVEDAPTAIIDVQEHLDWLLANEFKPKNTNKTVVRVERSAGPVVTTDRIECIKQRMFDGPRGSQLRRLYNGDASDYRKPDESPDWSSADGSLCAGAWYYSDGDAATTWAILLESGLARSRPNPEKLDRADYQQSTLQLVAGSKTFHDTHGYSAWEDPPRIQFTTRPPAVIGNDGASTCTDAAPATLADALALIAQLRQENTELRETVHGLDVWVDHTAGFVEELQACNATLSRKLTMANERLALLEPLVSQIDETISRPEEDIAPDGSKVRSGPTSDDKITAITVARWMPYYRNKQAANGEPETIALGYLAKGDGDPRKRISKSLHRQASDDPNAGAPWRTDVKSKPIFDNTGAPAIDSRTGKQKYESSLEVIPWGDTQAMLRASAKYVLPELPKHGGSKEATAHRWGRCERCPDAPVTLQGRCTGCKRILGEATVSANEFLGLNVQVGHLVPPATVNELLNSIERQNGYSVHPGGADRPNLQVVDSDITRAAAMVQTPLVRESADKHKRFTPKSENLGPILLSDHRVTPDDAEVVQEEPHWLQQRPDDLSPDATCTRCSSAVAPGDKLYCVAHRAEADQEVMPWERPAVIGGGEE